MRDEDNLASQVRNILIQLEELKTAQLVGHSQIKVAEYVSDELTVRSTSTGYMAEAYAHAIVVAPDIIEGNVLITYCVPEARTSNGTLIDNKTDGLMVNVNSIETDSDYTNAYQINVIRTSTGGETISAEDFKIKFHIYSAATVSITANGGSYGS